MASDFFTEQEYPELFARLSRSKFRSRFHLTEKDKAYAREKGPDTIRSHAKDFIEKRLAPAEIPNDGKQTPMRGASGVYRAACHRLLLSRLSGKVAWDPGGKGTDRSTETICSGCADGVDPKRIIKTGLDQNLTQCGLTARA